MGALQSSVVDRTIFLSLSGAPALGILPNDVVCKYRKTGETVFTTKTLSLSNWIDHGNGYYTVKFSGTETNVLGYFFYTLDSSLFDNFLYDEFSIEPVPSGNAPTPIPDMCVVSGMFKNLGNTVPTNSKVTFRPVNVPAALNGSILSVDVISTYLDINGNFSVALLQGTTVIVEVERTGIRHQIEIPIASSANLIDLLPPQIQIY
jgi:hypothetical protein